MPVRVNRLSPPMGESFKSRWSRRVKTVPTMLVATVLAFGLAPLLVPAAVVADLVRGRRRLPTVRVYGFLLQYLFNDSVEIVAAPVYWVRAGFGTNLASAASIERHQQLQWWSIRLLQRRAEQLLGLRIVEADGVDQALRPGPVIAVARHVSMFDASLPAVLFQSRGFRLRGAIMAELLADPGFDLVYARSGSVFLARDNGPEAVAAVRRMAQSVDGQTALAIFPEGRLFRPSVRDRQLARLVETDPERAERLAGLTNVLPPRVGGLAAMLEAAPEADVVVIRHRGFERLDSLRHLTRVAPLREPVTVEVTRIPRSQIPDDQAGRTEWLDDLWLTLDAELGAEL